MPDSLTWIMTGLGVAFGVAGISYYAWVFGIGDKLRMSRTLRIDFSMARLRGRFSKRDPADDVQQALNDALNGAPPLGGEPDDDLWVPEIRQPDRSPTQS